MKETKTNVFLHDYKLFSMKDNESISNMLDQFEAITNGLTSLGKPITNSEKV